MKPLFTLVLALTSLLLSAQTTCNNWDAQISPADLEYMYFSSTRGGTDYGIYRSQLDGITDLELVIDLPENDIAIGVSPDGTKLVFQNGDYNGDAEIYIIDVDGTGLTQLTDNGVFDGYPAFSPDGQKIIFAAWDDSNYPEIFTMNLDGSNRTQITNSPGAQWNYQPSFNPSGTYIYYQSGLNANEQIMRMNPDGSGIINITDPNSFGDADFGFDFTSDGAYMYYATTRLRGYNIGSDIVKRDMATGTEVFLTSAVDYEWFREVTVHPTSGQLYFSYLPDHQSKMEIHRMDSDGTNEINVSSCSMVDLVELDQRVSIYPNPASSELNIELFDGAWTLKAWNLMGQLQLEALIDGNVRVDVSDWPVGLYIVELVNETHSINKRVIIDR